LILVGDRGQVISLDHGGNDRRADRTGLGRGELVFGIPFPDERLEISMMLRS